MKGWLREQPRELPRTFLSGSVSARANLDGGPSSYGTSWYILHYAPCPAANKSWRAKMLVEHYWKISRRAAAHRCRAAPS